MPSELHDAFCGNLRALRGELGMTQQELADFLGVHRVRVCEMEAGRNAPTLDFVDVLAKKLKVPVSRLLKPKRKSAKSA